MATYLAAIADGLRCAMEEDDRVVVLGQDVAEFGGAFKVTDGLLERFGRRRVLNTPISESAMIGASVGLAVEGFRPVVEMQFADFVTCGFDSLVNVAAKLWFRQRVAVPMVVRLPSGGGFSGGPFHSQSPEAWFMHAPGLKVLAPSTPEDAKGLLIAAILDANPVVFLEHKHLYRRVKGDVPEGLYRTDMAARVARDGDELVIFAYGAMVGAALETAERIDRSIMVVDVRSLVPLDDAAIVGAVERCGKALVLDEANQTCAAGAQIASVIGENAFEHLDGPIVRVATPDVPIPFSPPLEAAVLPGVARIEKAARELLDY